MTEEMIYKERLLCSKQLFYNESSLYGAYGFKFAGEINPDIRLHPQYYNFTISGDVQPLVEGKEYTVRFKEGFSDKYGQVYNFVEVMSDGISGVVDNHEFIRQVLPPQRAETIIKAYPDNDNLIQDILDRKVDLTKLYGIGDATLLDIEKKLANYEDYSEAIVHLSSLGVGVQNVVKISDHFGSAAMMIKKTTENIYALTEVDGFGFIKVDKFALEGGMSKDSPVRIQAGAVYVIEQMINSGDTKIPIEDFDEEMCKILDITEVTDEVFDLILKRESIYYKDGFISLKKYYNEEVEIARHLKRIRDGFTPVVDVEEIERIIELNELQQGYKFNEQQKSAIRLGVKSGVMILDGRAGSGKSSSLKTAVDIIDTLGTKHIAVALSGKAAQVLAKNKLNASTIHRALEFNPMFGGFQRNEHSPLGYSVVILDEASMVNNTLFLNLISAVPTGSQFFIVGDSGQLPAIGHGAVFDYLLKSTEFSHVTLTEVHRQAQDSGTLMVANGIYEGEQFNRFTEQGMKIYGANKDLYSFAYVGKGNILNDLCSTVERYLSNPDTNNDDLQIITGLKSKGELSVLALNKTLQPLFNPETMGDDEIQSKDYTYRNGDRVIHKGNNYEAKKMLSIDEFNQYANGLEKRPVFQIPTKTNSLQAEIAYYASRGIILTDSEIEDLREAFEHNEERCGQVFNGTFGKIVACAKGVGVLIEFEDTEGLFFYENDGKVDELAALDLGYVITCHRSQGSGFKTLFVVITFSDFMLLGREFLYTALTRTIDKCFLFAETKAVHYAIKTVKGKARKCFLGDFIQ